MTGIGPAVLLFYARWAPKKGPDRLAAALRSLDRSDYELHLYGSGDRDAIAATFAGVAGEVIIGGWLEGERKITELGSAAALIAPSRAEGLPVALVEARAAGTPVIASDVGGVAEALRDYPLGLLLDPTDDGALREAIGRLLDGAWPPRCRSGPVPECAGGRDLGRAPRRDLRARGHASMSMLRRIILIGGAGIIGAASLALVQIRVGSLYGVSGELDAFFIGAAIPSVLLAIGAAAISSLVVPRMPTGDPDGDRGGGRANGGSRRADRVAGHGAWSSWPLR